MVVALSPDCDGNQSVLRVNERQTGVLWEIGKNQVEFEYRSTVFRVLTVLDRIMMLPLDFMILCAVQEAMGNSI
jgi:hypothetical protein